MILPTTKLILRKLGGDKKTSVIFPKTELELVPFTEGTYLAEYAGNVPFVLISGQQYKVVWNGVEYNLTGVACDDGEVTGAFVGNGGFLGMDDTGEPFLIAYSKNLEGAESVQIGTTDATATVSISTETIVPIDPKYLPGVCLPVVELETTLTADGALLSENDIAKLESTGFALPCIFKFALDADTWPFPATILTQGVAVEEDGQFMYVATGKLDLSAFGVVISVMVSNSSGEWVGQGILENVG